MKKISSSIIVVLFLIPMAWASPPVIRTTVRNIRSFPRAQAEEGIPVTIEAIVTYCRPQVDDLFVQDGDQGIFIETTAKQYLLPGDRVRITGTTAWGYSANIRSKDITLLGHAKLPRALPAHYEQLIQGMYDADFITVQGVVHAADLIQSLGDEKPIARLKVLTDGGYIGAEVLNADAKALKHLLDAKVEIAGVDGGKFDGKMQLTGVALRVNSLANVKVIRPAALDPWSLPLTAMDRILSVSNVKNQTARVHVAGTVTYFEPGAALVLQSGNKSLWVKTRSSDDIHIGDWAHATGFPDVSNGFLTLTGSEIQDTGVAAAIKPAIARIADLRSSRYIYDLVSVEGKVVMEAREKSQDEYVVQADGQMFSAVYSHRVVGGALPPMKDIPVGSTIRVTGICVTDDDNPFSRDVTFNILIRTADDLHLIAPPSMLTIRNLTRLVFALLLAVLAVSTRALWMGRNMRRKVAELGYVSQRRGEILEDINRLRPLAEILERITELASMTLKGAPCWCRIADGPTAGNCPPDLRASQLRIIETPIAAHAGHYLGSVHAAFDARTRPRGDESKALTAAAELATLAIETSRLHSDLVHRSEFDMLTEIQNRFAFEKRLEELIAESRGNRGVFCLIYIDLNDFKLVNDRYGHQAGDLYLQLVAERMKHQLRSSDMLARLGGDEFGVLVRVGQGRTEAEEIAHRLERCFDEPISVKNHIVRGSASIGLAMYPEDATSDDGLMSIADAAMYGKKRQRNRPGVKSAGEVTRLIIQPRDQRSGS